MTANNIPANVKKNIFSENIYPDWEIDEKFFIDIAKKILKFYLNQPEVTKNCCLKYKRTPTPFSFSNPGI